MTQSLTRKSQPGKAARMEAKVTGIWLIVECPHCLVPQSVNKYVSNNAVINLVRPRFIVCKICAKSFFVELKEMDTSIDEPEEKVAAVNLSL